MSIRKQWLWTIDAFVVVGATVGIAAGVYFLLEFAERATQEWLTTAYRNGVARDVPLPGGAGLFVGRTIGPWFVADGTDLTLELPLAAS